MNLIGPIYNGIISLLTRWTQTLADRLDAAISSRAPASTALSTATWTSTKAGYLDTPVSSCAPASSALSSGVWTLARAAKLDNLDAAISTNSPVKSSQTGSIDTATTTVGTAPETFYVDVTISAVTVAKALVLHSIGAGNVGTNAGDALITARTAPGTARAYLVNSTTLRIYGSSNAAATYRHLSGRWQVLEYK